MIKRSVLSWQSEGKGENKIPRLCSLLSWRCCCPSPGCGVHQHQQPGELRRVKSLRISVDLGSPLREEKLLLLLLLAAGWRLSVASLLHDPASLPVSQQRRPSQMLHGGAGVCHSTPNAPNTSQLLRAWTTTTTVANYCPTGKFSILVLWANRIFVSLLCGKNKQTKTLI